MTDIKGFKEFIVEKDEQPDNSEFIKGVEESFKRHFPNGKIDARNRKILGGWTVAVDIFLISNQSEQESNIWNNDPMFNSFWIEGDSEAYIAERIQGGGLKIKPSEGSYLAMETGKVPFRKARGNVKKMISTFDTHFKRLKDYVKKNEDNIYGREKINDKYFK